VREWLDLLEDDAADTFNYVRLARAALEKIGVVAPR